MNNPLNQIGPWNKRANFSVERHQQLVDGLNAVRQIIPTGDGTQVINGPFGQSIQSPAPRPGDFGGWFQLSGTAARWGVYTANPYQFASAPAPIDMTLDQALASSDLGNWDTGTTVYLANLLELDSDGVVKHFLTVGGGYYPQQFRVWFWMYAKDGKPIYWFIGDNSDFCATS